MAKISDFTQEASLPAHLGVLAAPSFNFDLHPAQLRDPDPRGFADPE